MFVATKPSEPRAATAGAATSDTSHGLPKYTVFQPSEDIRIRLLTRPYGYSTARRRMSRASQRRSKSCARDSDIR